VLLARGVLVLLVLGFAVYCVLDVLTTPSSAVRNLPKVLWLVLVLIFPVVCGVAWLVAGRPQAAAASGRTGIPSRGSLRPERAEVAPAPDDDEAFLRSLRERAEQQRARERARREAEQQGDDGPGDEGGPRTR